jgi:hypothetical protein
MIRRPAAALLVIWTAVFLHGALLPAVREIRERGATGLIATFGEYAAMRSALEELSRRRAGSGPVMVADADPPDVRRLVSRAEDAKYYLYPRRLFSFASDDPSRLVDIVFFGSTLNGDDLPKTCERRAAAYACAVRRIVTDADEVVPEIRVVDRTLVMTIPPFRDASDRIATILSIGFAVERLPVKEGFDLDLNVAIPQRHTPGSHTVEISLPTPALAPYIRARIVTLDSEGALFAGRPVPIRDP